MRADYPVRHENGRRHRNHRSNHIPAVGLAPQYPNQRPLSSSGSVSSIPQHRPGSVASVGAWIKSRSTNWYNQADPFGAMANYLTSMKPRNHRHRRYRSRHRRHHSPSDKEQPHHQQEEKHRRRRRHHRRHGEDGDDSRHRSGKNGHFFVDGLHPAYEVDTGQRGGAKGHSSSLSDVEAAPRDRAMRKRRKDRQEQDAHKRDKVVVVCFIVVNCIFAAIGLGVTVAAGLAEWSPSAYKSFYRSEVERIFADMMPLKTACGRNFENFELRPSDVLPGVFDKIFIAAIALFLVAVYGLVIPVVASRTPRYQVVHVVMYIAYILMILGITAATGIHLIIYFQNTDKIEAELRLDAKSSYTEKYRGNPTQSCDSISNFVNFMHRYFRCCGVDDVDDFEQSWEWDGTVVVDHRRLNYSAAKNEMDKTGQKINYVRKPLSCCRLGRFYELPDGVDKPKELGDPRGWLIDLCRRKDSNYFFTSRTSYVKDGCYPIVKEFFKGPTQIGLISLGVFCLIMLFACTLAFLQTRLC